MKTSKGPVWRPEAPPFRQFRATAAPTHVKWAVPKDPSQLHLYPVRSANKKSGEWKHGQGSGKRGESPVLVDAEKYTMVKVQSAVLCHPRVEGEKEQSCVRIAYLEKTPGWAFDPKYLGLMYVYIDEKGSSVFDEDQHLANCSCSKKEGPRPRMWEDTEKGVTQVVINPQSFDRASCFQPLAPEDYVPDKEQESSEEEEGGGGGGGGASPAV